MTHPYRLPQFQPKIVRGKKVSPVVLGSPVEEQMLQECEKYIRWMKENNCTNRRNSGYVTKCDCREDIREEDARDGAMQMVNFYSMSQRGRDVKIRDEILKARSEKKNPRFQKLGHRRKRSKVERMRGKIFHLFYSHRCETRARKVAYCVGCCLHTFLMVYNVPYSRFKTIENDVLQGKRSTPIHKLTGAPSNNLTKEATIDKMCIFLWC